MLQNISYDIKPSGTVSLPPWKQKSFPFQKISQHKPVALEVNREAVKSNLQRGVNSAQLTGKGMMFGTERQGERKDILDFIVIIKYYVILSFQSTHISFYPHQTFLN